MQDSSRRAHDARVHARAGLALTPEQRADLIQALTGHGKAVMLSYFSGFAPEDFDYAARVLARETVAGITGPARDAEAAPEAEATP